MTDNAQIKEEKKDAVAPQQPEKKENGGGEQKVKKERKPKKEATPGEEGQQEQGQEEVDNTFKVFVGNLAFATTEDDLRDYFSGAGNVVHANIIVRGTRSLGYGFISYDLEEEAQKAVSLYDKTELAGRVINVEQAKLKEHGEGAVRGGRGRAPRGRGGRGRGFRGRGFSRGGRGGRGGFGRRFPSEGADENAARVDEDVNDQGEGKAHGDDQENNEEGRRGGRRRGGGRGRGGPRGRRFSRGGGGRTPSGEPGSGETSSTTLFVANLPFKVTNEDLASIFKDYQVSSAHVVKLRNGRSKGFGFVEVESEEQQQKVLSELKNVVVDGRELVIKVALASQTPPVDDGADENAEGQAAEAQA